MKLLTKSLNRKLRKALFHNNIGETKMETNEGTQAVEISDIDIPFWRIVSIMVKWSIASIPALIILMILFAIVGGFLTAIFN